MAEDDLLVKILVLLDSGNYPAKVARILGFSKQKVDYWIRKAKRKGLVERKSRDVISLYRLTTAGRLMCQKNLTWGERRARLHHFAMKYEILAGPGIRVDWDKVRMNNWDRFVGSELGITVEKTSRSIIVHADKIYGRDPWKLFFLAYRECDRVAHYLESKFGMRLAEGELMRKPHFAIKDPFAKMVGGLMEFSDDIGKLDESEGEGELDLYDPNLIKDYLVTFTVLPKTVSRVLLEIGEIKELLAGYAAALKAFEKTIWEHLELIKEYREESRQNRKQIEGRTEQFFEAIHKQHELTESLVTQVLSYLQRPGLLKRFKNWLSAKFQRAETHAASLAS